MLHRLRRTFLTGECHMTQNLPEPSVPQLTLDLEDQLCFDLYAAARLITSAHRPFLLPLSLTYPQYVVMLTLWQRGPQTVTELGARLHLDSGTLSPLLKRLEVTGYITRMKSELDERATIINVTATGELLKSQAAAVPSAIACQVGLNLEEKQKLQDQLRALIARLSVEG